MFFWNPCCRQDGGRKSGGWFAHVDRPPSNGPSRRGQPSGRGTATWPAPMTWTLPPRQWRTRVRPSKTRADYLCEYIFSKFTARLPRRVTAHINNGAVFAQPLPEATQRPSLLTTARAVARAISKEKCSGPKAGTASSQRTTTTQHTVPLRSILYQGRYAAFCVWACHKWSERKRHGRKRPAGLSRPAPSRPVPLSLVSLRPVPYRPVPLSPVPYRPVPSSPVPLSLVSLSPVPAPPTRRAL